MRVCAAAEAVLQAQPVDDEMAVARARSLAQLGEVDAALKAYAEVLARSPRYAPARHYMGMAHMLKGDGKAAARAWRDLAAMDPDYAARHRLLERAAMAERVAGQ